MSAYRVRIEIRDAQNDSFISFIIDGVNFHLEPATGHFVAFSHDGWESDEVGQIQYLLHHCCCDGKPSSDVLVSILIKCRDQYSSLTVLDKFKLAYEIRDFQSNVDKPPAYYIVYRTMRKLWGKDVFDAASDLPASIGGLIFSMLLKRSIKSSSLRSEIEQVIRFL